MLGYGNSEPIPIVATIVRQSDLVFVMLPQGWPRNRPVRQLLLHYRKKTGEELSSTFVLVPPGVEWKSGWGIDPNEVEVSDNRLVFKLLGDKATEDGASAMNNEGTYRRRYSFEADLQ